ncbi:MAG: inositol monophosphatase family protein [Planctomycetia bacterium]|nr:inositol monophosphatase family protein [Planctomycetia bacterium]
MMEKNIQEYLTVAEETARAAGKVLLDYADRFHVREKGHADLVTEADFASQEKVKEMILGAFPTHKILGEENIPGTDAAGGPGVYRWIVDPLDGTTNYVHKYPHFAVSLALEYDREMQVGVIFAPMTGECFTAIRGGGAFLNGKQIHTSPETEIEKSLVAIGMPPESGPGSLDLRGFLYALQSTQGFRRTGSTALNIAYVASGRMDVAWHFRTKPWDVAAGTLMVREAGGVIRSSNGGEFCVDNGDFIATSTDFLMEKFLKLIPEV